MSTNDRAVTVFSPDGQLLQVQYAQEAVRKSLPAVGVRGANAIVLAVERKPVPQLQEARTGRKIIPLDDHVMATFAGLKADARVMICRAQMECQAHRLTIEDPVSTEYIARYIAQMKQSFTQTIGRRPFGISFLIGGFDYDGTPHLFQTDPSGLFYEWKAASIGRGEKTAREYLEKNYRISSVSSDNGAVLLAIKALLEVVQTRPKNFDVAILKRYEPLTLLSQDTIESLIAAVEMETSQAENKDT